MTICRLRRDKFRTLFTVEWRCHGNVTPQGKTPSRPKLPNAKVQQGSTDSTRRDGVTQVTGCCNPSQEFPSQYRLDNRQDAYYYCLLCDGIGYQVLLFPRKNFFHPSRAKPPTWTQRVSCTGGRKRKIKPIN